MVLLKLSAICGLLAPVAFTVGWVLGSFMQPARFDVVEDDISDLGAQTANSPWLYNQIAGNLAGILVVCLAAGLWCTLGSSRFIRVGVAALAVSGVGQFLDGLFRLDCRAIDATCTDRAASWHGTAHGIETVVTLVSLFVAMFALARGFRGLERWRDLAPVSVVAAIVALASLLALIPVSTGIAVLVSSTIFFLWIALVAYRLLTLSRDRPA